MMEDLVMEDMVLDLSHVTSERAIVHTLPFTGAHHRPQPTFRVADKTALSMSDIPAGVITVITGTDPISGQELNACREELVEAIIRLRAAAEAEGDDGFLLGYDPLNPERHIPSSELALGDSCLFIWNRGRGEGPIFEWSDVAHFATTEFSIHIYLVDGRIVFLHAAIDWWNLG